MKKYLVKVNGNQYEIEVEEERNEEERNNEPAETKKEPAKAVESSPSPVHEVRQSKTKELTTGLTASGAEITAPIPGVVLKVNVSIGDLIKKGQILLVLEAMKMENEIIASVDGKIAAIHVEKGTPVKSGELMVSIA